MAKNVLELAHVAALAKIVEGKRMAKSVVGNVLSIIDLFPDVLKLFSVLRCCPSFVVIAVKYMIGLVRLP